MFRVTLSIGICLLFAAGTSAAPAPEKEPASPIATAKKLARPVGFPGLEKDERVTLRDALDFLAQLYEVRFRINDIAFKAEVPPIPDVASTLVVTREPLPALVNVPLETVLRSLLDRIPTTSGATFTIRRGEIEITTASVQRAEFWGEHFRGPFLPLVHAAIDRRPLEDALKELADSADFNIVVDPRAAEKAKTVVTARMVNVPLDSAVRLLTDMADLKAFLVDNVLYVTTKENCARLEAEERAKLRPKKSGAAQGLEPPTGPRVGAGRVNSVPLGGVVPPLLP